ncbi:MAG: AraC family transcriptional regulator [Firmicutes bacterium]|nr:AraC family transcriptional regulator [Bacillota bacterium]
MKDLQQKIAYLQGQAAGLKLAADSDQGKLIADILDALEDMAAEIAAMHDIHDELEDYVESIDSDLSAIEEIVYDEDEEDDDDMVEVECPNCHEKVYFEADILDEEDPIEVTCPVCEAVVYSNDDDECGCCCGCCDDEEEEEEK